MDDTGDGYHTIYGYHTISVSCQTEIIWRHIVTIYTDKLS